MSRYTVDWTADAEDALALIWLGSTDPNGVAAAQDRIDRRLARDPIGEGQHVQEGLYRIVDSPLAAFYSIDATAKTVEVSGVGEAP